MEHEYDAFISYNSEDVLEVKLLARRLRDDYGLKVWFDRWVLRPGEDWIESLDNTISTLKSAIFCVGRSGVGTWQDKEIKAILIELAQTNRPVIPVLLPSACDKPTLPRFLKYITWIDYRVNPQPKEDRRLVWGITGIKPELKDKFKSKKPREEDNNDIYLKKKKNMNSLQEQIDKAKKGDTLEIPFGEFHESLTIKEPITLRGERYAIAIAGSSPTVSIESDNVVLDNIHIVSSDNDSICLSVQKGCKPKFKDVFLKGKVQGLEDEEGEWEIPSSLELSIIPEKATMNKFIISTPVPVKIYPSNLADISCHPDKLQPGVNEIEISIKEIRKGNLIYGDLIIETLKNKLKRKIAVSGNTLNEHIDTSTFDGKLIWECESNKDPVIKDFLQKIPQGRLGIPYEFILDLKDSKGNSYDITVDNLPKGLNINSSIIPHKIEGIPGMPGNFNLKWNFKVDGDESERSAILTIKDKISLEVEQLPDPIVTNENKELNIQFKIQKSNSSDITYQLINNLPPGLSFDDVKGEISGSIPEHGKHKIEAKVGDGTSELVRTVNLHVLPEEPLKVSFEKICHTYPNRDLTIPIVIENAEKLYPKVKLKDKPDKIIYDDTAGHIKGKLHEIKDYKVGIEIVDTYNRSVSETLCIKCIDEPEIEWNTPDPIEVEGIRGSRVDCQILATVVGDPKTQLKYSFIGKVPKNITLLDNGFLNVKILYDQAEKIKIKAEHGSYFSEKEFKVRTKIKRIIRTDVKPSGVFFEDRSIQKSFADLSFKQQLKEGRVGSPYSETFLMNNKTDMNQIKILVSNLPEGLSYNNRNHTIDGIPEKGGDYNILIADLNKSRTKQISLRINKRVFKESTKTKKQKEPAESKIKSDNPRLGSAFSFPGKPEEQNKSKVKEKPPATKPKKEKEKPLGGAFSNYKKSE